MIVAVAKHGPSGKGKEFRGLEEKLVGSPQTENKLIENTQGHGALLEKMKGRHPNEANVKT